MKKQILSTRFSLILLIFFCLLLIAIWFKDGQFLATGEDALFLVNPQRSLELYQHSWIELGPGISGSAYITRLPLLFFASFIVRVVKPWVFQAGLFFVLLAIGSIGTFFLVKELFQGEEKRDINLLALLASIFYIVNPISFLGVWYRFIYPFFFFFSLLPIFFYLFVKGINKKEIRLVFISSLLTLPFSVAFGGPSLAISFWILTGLLTVFKVFRKGFDAFPFLYFILNLLFWTAINLWWIFPYLGLVAAQTEFTQIQNLQHNIGTLVANSKDFRLMNTTRLIHGGVLYRGEAFGSIYKTPLFTLVSWITPLFVIYGLINIKNSFLKRFMLVSLVLLLFLAKGTSWPFGGLFLWLFTHFQAFQLFRNSLEKFGLLLPVIYAPLYSLGIISLLSKVKGSIKPLTLFLILIALFIFHWPFFTGAIVTFGARDIRVTVPDSFNQFNQINTGQNHRILNLPLMGGASGFYKWKYAGLEPSETLFKYPVISRVIYGDSSFDQLIVGVSKGLADKNLIGVAQLFATDLIAFRKDTDVIPHGAYLDALDRVGKMVRSPDLESIFDSKEFTMFKLHDSDINPIVNVVDNVVFGNSQEQLLTFINEKKFNPKNQAFICTQPEPCQSEVKENILDFVKKLSKPKSIRYTKFSPAEYNIEITESKGPFLLVFSNSYHPDWEIFYDNERLSDNRHFVVNGYANGYVIDRKGDLSLNLVFSQQKTYKKYLEISYAFMIFGALVFLVLSLKKILK